MSNRRTPFKMLYQPVPKFNLTADNTVLLILDMQKLIDSDGGMAKLASLKGLTSEFKDFYESLEGAKENIQSILQRGRNLGIKVIFTRIVSSSGKAADIGPQTSIWDESFPYNPADEGLILPYQKGELILDKICSNPFNCTNLEDILHELGVRFIIICGVRTPGYLNTVSFDAADRGFGVITVSDASVGGIKDGTRNLAGGLIRVRTTQSVLDMLEAIGG
jgi:nicotinamidase-related amidase